MPVCFQRTPRPPGHLSRGGEQVAYRSAIKVGPETACHGKDHKDSCDHRKDTTIFPIQDAKSHQSKEKGGGDQHAQSGHYDQVGPKGRIRSKRRIYLNRHGYSFCGSRNQGLSGIRHRHRNPRGIVRHICQSYRPDFTRQGSDPALSLPAGQDIPIRSLAEAGSVHMLLYMPPHFCF